MNKTLVSVLIGLVAISTLNAQTNQSPAELLRSEVTRGPALETLVTTPAERKLRLAWWREARFGMFVHWGVYSRLGGTWRGTNYHGYAEHIQRMAKIPISVYRQEVAGKFDPVGFNADEWVRLAKRAGMAYLVITAKHHDGFAMYDSHISDYNIVKATPFGRDPMKDLRASCKKYGLKFGFYYSHAFDWGDSNAPGNDWDYQNPGGDKLLYGEQWWKQDPQFLLQVRKYVDSKAIPQILELIHDYDPDIMWFDTPHKLPPEENQRIMAAVRRAKPTLVVNGRLIYGLGDYESTSDCPVEFPPHDGDWEGIPTTNDSYGYNKNDHSHKPVAFFIQLLAKAAARGGNLLMNIGPRGDGKIDGPDMRILGGIAQWWQVNGESIRGTTRTPLAVQAWGESTLKGNTLYLHVFNWPRDGKLVVGGLKTEVVNARLLAAPARSLKLSHSGMDWTIAIPQAAPDAVDSVIAVKCVSEPLCDSIRLLAANVSTNSLRSFDARLEGHLQFGSGQKNNDTVGNWTSLNDAVVWPVRVSQTTTFALAANYDAPKASRQPKLIEGDAGNELQNATRGAEGRYLVSVGPQSFVASVRAGNNMTDSLGQVTLPPGCYDIRVTAKEIVGGELFHLRRLDLVPVADPHDN